MLSNENIAPYGSALSRIPENVIRSSENFNENKASLTASKDTLADSKISDSGIVFAFGKLHSQQPFDTKVADNAVFSASNALLPLKFFLRADYITNVACGDEHSVFISNTGRVFVVGRNNMGQLGLDLPLSQAVTRPTCIKSLKSERAYRVGCGAQHTLLAVHSSDGKKRVLAFGVNSDLQLGIGPSSGDMCSTPQVVIESEADDVLMLSGGRSHSALVFSDYRLLIWGSGPEGQLGLGDQCIEADIPVQLEPPPGYDGFTAVACGSYHTLAITIPPALFAFGESEEGKLGIDTAPSDTYVSDLRQVHLGKDEVVAAIAAGGSHSFAVTSSGHVYAMGSGTHGQLGIGTSVSAQSSVGQPCLIKSFADNGIIIRSVAAGESHSAFVTDDGRLFLCGNALHSRLGFDVTANAFLPRLANLVDENSASSTTDDQRGIFSVASVSCGGCHTVCLANKLSNTKLLIDTTNFSTTSSFLTASSARLGRRARRSAAQSLTLTSSLIQTPPVAISKSLSELPPIVKGAPSIVSTMPTADLTAVSTMENITGPPPMINTVPAENTKLLSVPEPQLVAKLDPPSTAPPVLMSVPLKSEAPAHLPPAPVLTAAPQIAAVQSPPPAQAVPSSPPPQQVPAVAVSPPTDTTPAPTVPENSDAKSAADASKIDPVSKAENLDTSRSENSVKQNDTTPSTPKTPSKKSGFSLPLICGNKKDQTNTAATATPRPNEPAQDATAKANAPAAAAATDGKPTTAPATTDPAAAGDSKTTTKEGETKEKDKNTTQPTPTKTCSIL